MLMDFSSIIQKNLTDCASVFVFPSEITARFWLKKSFQYSSSRAVSAKRFQSWDQFKKSVFRYPADLKPVNQALRILFIDRLLEENRQKVFFKRIISPEYAGNSRAFSKSFTRILPTLHHIKQLGPAWPEISQEKQQDLHLLWGYYSQFLEQNKLFEPNFVKPWLEPEDRSYFLFFPEVIEDYANFQSLISSRPEIRIIKTDSGGAPAGSKSLRKKPAPPGITAFENSMQEISWVISKIADLLDRGIDPEQIVLTVSNLEQVESYLKRAARLYEVPLNFRIGKPLHLYTEARLFKQIAECVETDFSLESLKALLLNQAVPWKDRRSAGDLIRLGIDFKILGNLHGGNGQDQWQEALGKAERCRAYPELSLKTLTALYRGLKAQVRRIFRADDFRQLKDSLNTFAGRFLDTSSWAEEQLKIYQFALKTLDELIEASSKADLSLVQPYPVWLQYLEQQIYVRRDPSCGIQVYPYRASAGVYPEYHFIMNASQEGTARTIKHFPFLSIHEQGSLADSEQNLSDHYLKLYDRSGHKTFFSYSRRSFSDTHLPPAFFVSQGNILPFSAVDRLTEEDLFAAEQQSWTGRPFPVRLYPSQKEGFASSIQTILAEKDSDFSREAVQDQKLIRRIRQELLDDDSHFRISATALETFQNCPFQYLLERAVGLCEETYQPVLLEPREFGEIMHRVLQSFYTEIIESEKRLAPSKLELYREMVERCVAAVISSYERCRPVPIKEVFRELGRRAEELALAHIKVELKQMPAEVILFAEKRLDLLWAEEGICLSGKIDRISRTVSEAQDGYTLVDYKKKNIPAQKKIFGPAPVSFQMPFYLYLMKQNGMEVAKAAYYSVEDERYKYIIHPDKKAMTDPEGLAGSINLLLNRIREMDGSIRSGRYMVPVQEEKDRCTYCAFHGVCRSKYVVRD